MRKGGKEIKKEEGKERKKREKKKRRGKRTKEGEQEGWQQLKVNCIRKTFQELHKTRNIHLLFSLHSHCLSLFLYLSLSLFPSHLLRSVEVMGVEWKCSLANKLPVCLHFPLCSLIIDAARNFHWKWYQNFKTNLTVTVVIAIIVIIFPVKF